MSNKVEDGPEIIPLLLEGVQAFKSAVNIGFPSTDFGCMFGVVPEVGLGNFPFQFFEFGGQFWEVKDTSGIPECGCLFFPYVDECLLA